MRIFAYCCKSFEEATRKAAGVIPVTSPPVIAYVFEPQWLENRDFIWFDLHGAPGLPHWYGDDGLMALTAETLRCADLGGAVVFATNCHLADEGSPTLDALLEAGARYVIGGDGKNWGSDERTLFGANLLGMWVRWLLATGADPVWALRIAKGRLRLQLAAEKALGRESHAEAARDTLGFRAYYRRG